MLLTPNTIASASLLTLALLIFPLLTTLDPSPLQKTWALSHVKTAVKYTFIVNLLSLFLFLDEGAEVIVINWQ